MCGCPINWLSHPTEMVCTLTQYFHGSWRCCGGYTSPLTAWRYLPFFPGQRYFLMTLGCRRLQKGHEMKTKMASQQTCIIKINSIAKTVGECYSNYTHLSPVNESFQTIYSLRHYAFPIGTNNSNILITLASLLPKRCVFFVFITTILLLILCRSSGMNLSAVATLDRAVASCQAPRQLFLREFRSSVPLARIHLARDVHLE